MTSPIRHLRGVLSILLSLAASHLPAQDDFNWQPLLDRHFSAEVQQAAMATTHTALYMTSQERHVLAYLNLARTHPQEFATFFEEWLQEDHDQGLEKFENGDAYYATLHADLLRMKPLPPVQPRKKLWRAARFWARYSGKRGLVGHDRPWYPIRFQAECCDYNPDHDAMTMLLDLLVDEGVKSLGHRRILLGKYTTAGASIQPHTRYGWCLVMDLDTGR